MKVHRYSQALVRRHVGKIRFTYLIRHAHPEILPDQIRKRRCFRIGYRCVYADLLRCLFDCRILYRGFFAKYAGTFLESRFLPTTRALACAAFAVLVPALPLQSVPVCHGTRLPDSSRTVASTACFHGSRICLIRSVGSARPLLPALLLRSSLPSCTRSVFPFCGLLLCTRIYSTLLNYPFFRGQGTGTHHSNSCPPHGRGVRLRIN